MPYKLFFPQAAVMLYIINLDADWLKTLLKVKLNNSAESLPSQQAEEKTGLYSLGLLRNAEIGTSGTW